MGSPKVLTYLLDQYSESADPQLVELDPAVPLATLDKMDLVLQGNQGGQIISKSNVRITTTSGTNHIALISLVDLQRFLAPGGNQVQQGLYVGTVFETQANTDVALLKVTFKSVSCP